jgi:Ku protein
LERAHQTVAGVVSRRALQRDRGSTKISFHQIHEPTGKRVRHEKTVPGVGRSDTDEIMKGFEYEKGEYVLLDDEELDAVKLETRKTLELTQFVDYDEVSPLYFERPYFMVPGDSRPKRPSGSSATRLRETRKMGLGKLAIRGREYIAAVRPCGKGLLLETLRFEDEVREAEGFFPRHRRRGAAGRAARRRQAADRAARRQSSMRRSRTAMPRRCGSWWRKSSSRAAARSSSTRTSRARRRG